MKQWKMTEWKGGSGRWYANCVDDLAGTAGLWWYPSRILGISPAQFILLLKDKFNVSYFNYNPDNDFLLYSWDNQADAHRWVLYINKIARQKMVMLKDNSI